MIIGFVPLRGGSKSIKNKNIKNFAGKPLCYWSLKSMQDSKIFKRIIVATDSIKIEKTVLNFNFSKLEVYRRLEKNSKDNSSTESVILEYLNMHKIEGESTFFLVQATSPFVKAKDFVNAFEIFNSKKYDSILTGVRLKRFLWTDDHKPINYNFNKRPRRQKFKGTFMENGAFYISKVDNIIQSKNRISGRIGFYEMDEINSIEIDEKEDWIIAEKLFYNKLQKLNNDIKLFVSDVDGTLTDAGMYYGNNGEEFKKFNTHDGKGFELLKMKNIKTAIITSEQTDIVIKRAQKLKIDFLYQGLSNKSKFSAILEICEKLNITSDQVAYIGDDINCFEALENVGIAACPKNSQKAIKKIPNIIHLKSKGGKGAVREFIDEYILVNG